MQVGVISVAVAITDRGLFPLSFPSSVAGEEESGKTFTKFSTSSVILSA